VTESSASSGSSEEVAIFFGSFVARAPLHTRACGLVLAFFGLVPKRVGF
jgi:hypothetical protein